MVNSIFPIYLITSHSKSQKIQSISVILPFIFHLILMSVCVLRYISAECQHSEVVIVRQRDYKDVAMNWHSKQYATVGRAVVSIGSAPELYATHW
jgi:hypothetical protein